MVVVKERYKRGGVVGEREAKGELNSTTKSIICNFIAPKPQWSI